MLRIKKALDRRTRKDSSTKMVSRFAVGGLQDIGHSKRGTQWEGPKIKYQKPQLQYRAAKGFKLGFQKGF